MENKKDKRDDIRDSELCRERPVLKPGDLHRSDEEMNEIRKRVLTFDPEVLIIQGEIKPSLIFPAGKKKLKPQLSKSKKNKKALRDTQQDGTRPGGNVPIAGAKEKTSKTSKRMTRSGQVKIENNITVEYEDATEDNGYHLVTNTVTAGTPGTEGHIEMINSYKEFIPEVKKTHYEHTAPTLLERWDDATWIACDIMKGVFKRDMSIFKHINLGAGNAVKDTEKSAGESLKNIGRIGTLRGSSTIKCIGKSVGKTSTNVRRAVTNKRASIHRDPKATKTE